MFRNLRPRHLAAGLAAATAAFGTFGLVGPSAGPASAAATAGLPPALEKFADCPVQNPDVTACYYIETSSTSMTAGSFPTMATTDPMVLQFGTVPDRVNQTSIEVAPANGVPALQAPAIRVPGGLLHMPWADGGILAAWITPTLIGLPELNLDNLNTQGDAPVMELDLKARVHNPITDVLSQLGDGCYIGSDDEPIDLNLTTGTTNPPGPNQPISGEPGTFDFSEIGAGVIKVTGQTVVDNTWGLPHASGCGPGGIFNWAVDLDSGQANAGPGNNEAILDTTIYQANADKVREALAAPGEKLADAGFEDSGLGPWECIGQCGVDEDKGLARSGDNNGFVMNNDNKWNDIHQAVSVAPNTDYTLTGYVKSSLNNSDGYFGVREMGGEVISEEKYGVNFGYDKVTVAFNSGNRTRVTVFGGVWANSVLNTWARFDDISLTAN